MAEVIELCESGGITDDTLVYTDDVEMDGWTAFGEIKESLDWEEGDGEEGRARAAASPRSTTRSRRTSSRRSAACSRSWR